MKKFLDYLQEKETPQQRAQHDREVDKLNDKQLSKYDENKLLGERLVKYLIADNMSSLENKKKIMQELGVDAQRAWIISQIAIRLCNAIMYDIDEQTIKYL